MSDTIKVVSGHAEDLADGRIALPGVEVKGVDVDDPHNARLIAEGRALNISEYQRGRKSSEKEAAASKGGKE